jgi:hypothetical protein
MSKKASHGAKGSDRMNVIGHAKWCDRKGELANMGGNYCSTCGQVVLLKTGKTEEERSLEARLAEALEALEAAQGEAYLGALADGDPLRACHEVIGVCVKALASLKTAKMVA